METILKNKSLTAIINSKGAELTSLQNNDREFMWDANPEFWGKNSPVLFPIVGTLKDNAFQYESKTYSLPRHGFARDMEFGLIQKSETNAIFSLSSNEHTLAIYPFEFEFQILYTLTEHALEIGYKVINKTNETLFFSVGAHPAFALPLAFEEYSIQMQNDEDLTFHLLENDLLSDRTKTLATENKRFKLSYPLFENDALIFKNLQSRSLKILEKEKPFLKINFEHFPYLGIWTKINAPFICIEPWFGHSDPISASGNLTQKEGIQTLAPNTHFDCAFTIEIL